MAKQLKIIDVSDYLGDEETIAEYLNAILEDGDQDLLLSAIGDVAKAKGMKTIAQASGLGRESLYKALNPGAKPRFETIIKVLKALGVNLAMKPARMVTRYTETFPLCANKPSHRNKISHLS